MYKKEDEKYIYGQYTNISAGKLWGMIHRAINSQDEGKDINENIRHQTRLKLFSIKCRDKTKADFVSKLEKIVKKGYITVVDRMIKDITKWYRVR